MKRKTESPNKKMRGERKSYQKSGCYNNDKKTLRKKGKVYKKSESNSFERPSINSKSECKKSQYGLRRPSSRKFGAGVVKRKNKSSSAVMSELPNGLLGREVKSHSQSQIKRKIVSKGMCLSRKRKNNNQEKKQELKGRRLSTNSKSHVNNRCNLCKQPAAQPSKVARATRSKNTNLPHVVVELPCKKSIFDKACKLRQTIESGDLLPASLQPLLNENVAKKYDTDELVATIKESKFKWEQNENHMLHLECSIRAELSIQKGNPEKCLPLLDELNTLDIDALMLKKNPRLVHTVQRLCQYVGHRHDDEFTEEEKQKFAESVSQVRCKSEALFQKFQQLFNVEGGQSFMRVYKDKIREYHETKNSKFLRELCQRVNKAFHRNKMSEQLKKRAPGSKKK